MNIIFDLNEKFKENLVLSHNFVIAHTSFKINGVNDDPIYGKLLTKAGLENFSYYENLAVSRNKSDINFKLLFKDFLLFGEKIKEIDLFLTDLLIEHRDNILVVGWAIFLK